MLSKILPWDFIVKYPQTIKKNARGIYSFLIEDPYIERVLLDHLPKKELSFSLYTGSEFTKDFIEEHFLNLSFFESVEHILILNAENIPANSLDFLQETTIDWSDRSLLLFFSKTGKSLSAFLKSEKVHAYEIEAPRFWEGAKMWQFCQKARGVVMDGNVSRFALNSLEHNFESFFWLLDLISMHFPSGAVDITVLQELVKKERWDFFELIDLFHRDSKLFFKEVLKKEIDFEWMRALSVFMQAHMQKILFPDELRLKNKLTKYDQGILEMSEKMNRDSVKYYQHFFSQLEIQSKSSDPLLVNRLRIESLK